MPSARCPICGSTHMVQRLTFICAGKCTGTAHQFKQHSPYLCRALAKGDAAEVASVLAWAPDYKLVDYRYAKSIAAN